MSLKDAEYYAMYGVTWSKNNIKLNHLSNKIIEFEYYDAVIFK